MAGNDFYSLLKKRAAESSEKFINGMTKGEFKRPKKKRIRILTAAQKIRKLKKERERHARIKADPVLYEAEKARQRKNGKAIYHRIKENDPEKYHKRLEYNRNYQRNKRKLEKEKRQCQTTTEETILRDNMNAETIMMDLNSVTTERKSAPQSLEQSTGT